jgi:hypothetical protein
MSVISWKNRHPDRAARAAQRQNAAMAQKFVGGRAGKDALMVQAREVAAAGACAGWLQVLNAMERDGHDTALLRIWANEKDKGEIDRLCARARGPRSRLASSRFKPRNTEQQGY